MTITVVRPPIPVQLANRPVVGGVVVPWVNVRLADGGVDFRRQHRARADVCWTRRRCQICSGPIHDVFVLIGGPSNLADWTFQEPPMHPVCAAYVAAACPMVAGRLSHFASGPSVSEGQRGRTCAEPGCDCDGWVRNEPGGGELGRPAHAWFSVWADTYALAFRPDGTLYGGQLVGPPRRVRHVSDPPACPAGAS